MRVLWHLSHHSSARADGWSGAPDEARWIREDLTPRVIAACHQLGVDVVTVDGDLNVHPEFSPDYDAFCAPHYEANVHQGQGGWFWGRAALSVTAARDDALGAIFHRRYAALVGAQIAMRPEWSNPNVTDYYGFRLTSPNTPGILVEHGVGAPGAADHDWLRANVEDIAGVWALSLAEFGGLVTSAGPKPTTASLIEEEDDVTAKEIAEKVLADAGLDPKSIETLKEHMDGHIHVLDALTPRQTTVPLHPPVEGAMYVGDSADFSEIFWDYPDGTRHTWLNGKEVPRP